MLEFFHTSSVQESERYAYWHEVICNNFCRAESKRLEDADFSASLSRGALGCIEISTVSCDPLRYERGISDLRGAPSEDFLLSVLLEGQGCLSQHDRYSLQRPGDIVVYDTAQPFLYEFPEPYKMVLVKIPRKALLMRIPDAERLTSIVVGPGSAVGGLAANMIVNAASVGLPADTVAAGKIGSSIIDVVAAMLEVDVGRDEQDCERQSTQLKRAKAYIRTNLDNPDLDIDSIANAMCVSKRTLSRLFALEGTTVIRWVWKERLVQSHHALTEGRSSKVTEVALNFGFSSFSHFSRAFKATYGVAPHTLVRPSSQAH